MRRSGGASANLFDGFFDFSKKIFFQISQFLIYTSTQNLILIPNLYATIP